MIVASIHWGGNWGYRIRDEETCFAHRLALYGCGDFLNDYEGISGYEMFRSA